MKDELINNIKILALGCDEIVFDIDLGVVTINSIELRDEEIILHSFVGDLDFEAYFDDIEPLMKRKIYNAVCSLLYN